MAAFFIVSQVVVYLPPIFENTLKRVNESLSFNSIPFCLHVFHPHHHPTTARKIKTTREKRTKETLPVKHRKN